jgi:hypothetical protein
MSKPSFRFFSPAFCSLFSLLALSTPLVMSCDKAPGGAKLPAGADKLADAAAGCDELKTGDFSSLKLDGDASVQGKVKGFLGAVFSVQNASVELEASLMSACATLGQEIGLSEDEVKADPGDGKGAEKICSAVSAKIDSILKAKADAKLTIEVAPPTCHVPVEAAVKCFEGCGAAISPAEFSASCKGGEIAGKCDAECKGSCTVEAGGSCTGSCSASCEGSCDVNFSGTCGGKCKGTCDGKKSKGKCAGTCEGSCDAQASGSCGGTCSGTCSASCEMKAQASCEGTCSGGCSVEVKEPSCTGSFEPPSVDATCQLDCAGKLQAQVTCTEPSLKVAVSGKVDEEFTAFVKALRKSLPEIAKLQLGTGKRVAVLGEGVVSAGAGLSDVGAKAGAKAVACISEAVKVAANASASIDVSVKASASVSASASGSASGSAG